MSEIGLPLDKKAPKEPLSNNPMRDDWVESQGAKTAQQFLASAVNHLSSYTVRNMTDESYLQNAQEDDNNTINRKEFDKLMSMAGASAEETEKNAQALFNMMDKDGDGELTEEEMRQLKAMKSESAFTSLNKPK